MSTSPTRTGGDAGGTDRPSGPHSRRRRRLFALFAVLLSLVVSLLVAEVVLQAVYYANVGEFLFARFARPFYAQDPYCAYRLKPSIDVDHRTSEFTCRIITNTQGFRVGNQDRVYAIPKPDDVYRVLLLGPSFAFGWGVNYEDAIGTRIEEVLNDSGFAPGKRVEVINGGVPGLGPTEQLKWFRQRGKDYQPDLVIQIAYGTLAVETHPHLAYTVTPDGYLTRRDVSTRKRVFQLVKKSALVYYTWVTLTKLSTRGGEHDTGQVEGAGQEMSIQARFDPSEPDTKDAIEFLKGYRDAVEDTGAQFIVLHFPLAYCIHREDLARWRHLGVAHVQDQNRINKEFSDYLNAHAIHCANITQALIDAAKASPDRLYYWLDVHFTPKGNDVAAHATVEEIEQFLAPSASAGAPTAGP